MTRLLLQRRRYGTRGEKKHRPFLQSFSRYLPQEKLCISCYAHRTSPEGYSLYLRMQFPNDLVLHLTLHPPRTCGWENNSTSKTSKPQAFLQGAHGPPSTHSEHLESFKQALEALALAVHKLHKVHKRRIGCSSFGDEHILRSLPAPRPPR